MNFSKINLRNNKPLIAWTLSLLLISIFIVKANYVARENDSRLYSRFTAQLNSKPLSQFLALEWRDYSWYAETETPYVRDHLTGQFILPVLLAKLGYSEKHSIYFVNSFYKALSLFFIFLIACKYFPRNISALMTILVQITPVSLNYQMRANHEPALLLLVLMAIYGVVKLNENKRYLLLILFSIQFCFLIKGIAFLPIIPVIFAIYFLTNRPIKISQCSTLVLISSSVLLTALVYEVVFKKLTHVSFFEQYIKVQLLGRSFSEESSSIPLLGNIKAFGYYFSRLLSYSLPWSLVAIIIMVKNKFSLSITKRERNFYYSLLSAALIYVLTFSISSRTASRYIYPSYFLVSSVCIMFILNNFKEKLSEKETRFHIISAITFLILTSISIFKAIGNEALYPH